VPGSINYPIAIFIIFILVNYVGMVYGPVGAFLAEFFPGRIRYTSVSVPYHIGNGWGGGLVPFITSAAFRGHRQHRLRAALPDPCSRGVLRHRDDRDAGDPQEQHLDRGAGEGGSVAIQIACGSRDPHAGFRRARTAFLNRESVPLASR
jgi:hypothetical protein